MGTLTHSQIASLNKAILHLHEPMAFQHFHERAFEAAAMFLRFDVAGFSAMNMETKAADSFLNVPALGPLLRLFEHLDDFYAMPGLADGAYFSTAAPTSMHDFITLDAFKGRAIYEFFYKEVDVLYDACLNFHAYSGSVFCALHFARKRRFSAEERHLLHLLQPHIGQRYRQLLAGDQGNPLAGHMALREQDWIICDGEGRIRARSPRVPEILRQFGLAAGSSLPQGWMTWLRGEMRSPGVGLVPHPLVVERGRRRMTIHCLPNCLSGEHRLFLGHAALPPDTLSRRERNIAHWLAAGKTNAEIGEILGISHYTVKRHVQSILAKLGAENRTSAALLLAASEESSGPLG